MKTHPIEVFLSKIEKENIDVHTLVFERKGKKEFVFEKRPYNTSEQTALFSLSKSFVAVAVLFAIQEGKIEETQKLSEFFDDNG